MDGDLPVLCFQHCDRRANIFCFNLPLYCVLCGVNLETAELRIPPFRIPSPFRAASISPCAVVIKPVTGDFLHTYHNSTDLHIGVTNSHGIVHEYDQEGMINSKSGSWQQCLAINVIPNLDRKWKDFWDHILQLVSYQESWTAARYNEEDHNCYKFVLTFLRALQLPSLNHAVQNKTLFCREFILPHTTHAAKYITVYRKLLDDGVFVQRCSA